MHEIDLWYGEQQFQDFVQAEITNNTVNGKLLIYWQNMTGSTVPSDAGQIIIVNCTDVIVTGQNLSNISTGLLVVYSSNIVIQNNTISDNEKYGILLRYSKVSIICGVFVIQNNKTTTTQSNTPLLSIQNVGVILLLTIAGLLVLLTSKRKSR